jgi:hypothetical protein
MKYRTQCPVCRGAVKNFVEWSESRISRDGKRWDGGPISMWPMPLTSMGSDGLEACRSGAFAEIDICPKCGTAFS